MYQRHARDIAIADAAIAARAQVHADVDRILAERQWLTLRPEVIERALERKERRRARDDPRIEPARDAGDGRVEVRCCTSFDR